MKKQTVNVVGILKDMVDSKSLYDKMIILENIKTNPVSQYISDAIAEIMNQFMLANRSSSEILKEVNTYLNLLIDRFENEKAQ
tara:strand:- start:993 stop:1241 length:249 start_codon:yes stop_codon:yes gene_type:complete